MPRKRFICLLVFLLTGQLLTGCAGPLFSGPGPFHIFQLRERAEGTYHRVERGETLWRISKNYGVPLEDVVRLNRIRDSSRIKAGQVIRIPGKREQRAAAVTYPRHERQREKPSVLRAGDVRTAAKGDFIWPLEGKLSSYFGKREGGLHSGIDIAARQGKEIRASRGGTVCFAGVMRGYGNIIIIDHGDGYSTVYAHNRVNLVKENDRVRQGDVIGQVGATGRARGSHLHFEIRKGIEAVNPLFYLP